GEEDARGPEDRVGDALEGADHDDRSQAGRALTDDDVDRGRDVLGTSQDRATELVDDDRRPGVAHRNPAQAGDAGSPATPSPRGSGPPAWTISGSSARVWMGRTSVGIGSPAGVIERPSVRLSQTASMPAAHA